MELCNLQGIKGQKETLFGVNNKVGLKLEWGEQVSCNYSIYFIAEENVYLKQISI